MTSVRVACFVSLLCSAPPVLADIPGPDGRLPQKPWGAHGAPPPGWFEQNAHQNPATGGCLPPPTPKPTPTPEPPRKTGPFRSCGSGMGTGLAGIGLAWGMLWLGNRFTGRTRKS